MSQILSCPECKVPRQITDEHAWLDNGVIVSKRDRRHRMAFIESENLDPLYSSISRLIETPIERIVIDVSRRRTHEYIDRLIPDEIKDLFQKKQIELKPLIDIMLDTALVMGYGKQELRDLRYEMDERDYVTIRMEEPYSLPLACGNFAGTVEALVGMEPGITYVEVAPKVYDTTVSKAQNPPELKNRLGWKGYLQELKEGDIELEKCATCGGPAALSGFKWHLDRGIIKSSWTHRRMAILGPAMLDPVFEELGEELGETIPRVIVEAQRQFIKAGFYSLEEVGDEGDIRYQFALRGLGNVREIKMGKRGIRLHLENAAMHLLMVGLFQGLFEMAFGVESNVDWELSEQGDLEMEVIPAGTGKTVTV